MKKYTLVLILSFCHYFVFGQQLLWGGQTIPITKAPYQVSLTNPMFADPLGDNNSHFCGGSIISDRWILTAAHCIEIPQLTAADITVRVSTNVPSDANTGTNYSVSQIFLHPNYDNRTLENDIALLYLSSPIQFSNTAMPIEYANTCNTRTSFPTDFRNGDPIYITGWGHSCLTCPKALFLQGAESNFMSNTQADWYNLNYRYSGGINSPFLPLTLNSSHIAVHRHPIPPQIPAVSGDQGDSGGPAVLDKKGNKINIGVFSWQFVPQDLCPDIYTNVRNYSAWIESITGFSISKPGIDLYSKDRPWDMGFEPSNVSMLWDSEDIWIRKQNDGVVNQVHQNPEYYTIPTNKNYVNIRVRNRGCLPSNGTEKVRFNWAKAGTALNWPDDWNGHNTTLSGKPLGGFIGEVTLPVIDPGATEIVSIPWNAPNPADYVGELVNPLFGDEEPHHFCIIARIISADDPMTVSETNNVAENTNSNNNIVWKNFSVVDLDPTNKVDGVKIPNGANIFVGDAWGTGGVYDFEFKSSDYEIGKPVTSEAEVNIKLNDALWQKWQMGGFLAENIEIVSEEHKIIRAAGENAWIKNLTFSPNEKNVMNVKFNFLTKEVGEQTEFDYWVIQRKSSDNSMLGGETYKIIRKQRQYFEADASGVKVISRQATTTLSASNIGEQAIYNWYDEAGNLIYTGKDITVSPDITKKYKLEVIADVDGFKDYKEIEVKVKEFSLKELTPNPARTDLNVVYDATTANSAYLVITPLVSGVTNQYILNTSLTSKEIDVSNYQSGQYTVLLVCNGNIVDFMNILIE